MTLPAQILTDASPPESVDNAAMVTDARAAEYESVVAGVTKWAESQADIVAVGLVGSWARGNQHDGSDVDFVVLTLHKTAYTAEDSWIEASLCQTVQVVRRAEWGVLTERRLLLPSGFEVEFGFVEPSWAHADPIDPGTAELVIDGGLLRCTTPRRCSCGWLGPRAQHPPTTAHTGGQSVLRCRRYQGRCGALLLNCALPGDYLALQLLHLTSEGDVIDVWVHEPAHAGVEPLEVERAARPHLVE